MDNANENPLVPVLAGTFERPWMTDTALADLVGQGSTTVRKEGLQITGMTSLRRRTQWLIMACILIWGASCGVVTGVGASVPVVVATQVALLGGMIALIRRSRRLQPFSAMIPWQHVQRPGISEGMLCFQLRGVLPGQVRFRVPNYGLRELQPIARTLVHHATGS